MKLRLLAAPALLAAGAALGLAPACSGGSLPEGEFPLDAAALDLGSCTDGAVIEIQSINCEMAACGSPIAYAICTGTTYGACSCKGNAGGSDAQGTPDAIMTGTEGGVPDVGASESSPPDTGPGDTGPSDTGPTDTGPTDTGPVDTGVKDTGPKDTGVKDSGPKDTGKSG